MYITHTDHFKLPPESFLYSFCSKFSYCVSIAHSKIEGRGKASVPSKAQMQSDPKHDEEQIC